MRPLYNGIDDIIRSLNYDINEKEKERLIKSDDKVKQILNSDAQSAFVVKHREQKMSSTFNSKK